MGYCPFCIVTEWLGAGRAGGRAGRAGRRRGAGLGVRGALGWSAWGARQGRVAGVARGRGAQAGALACAGVGAQAGGRGARRRAAGAGCRRARRALGARACWASGRRLAAGVRQQARGHGRDARGARGRARQQARARAERAGQGWLGGRRVAWALGAGRGLGARAGLGLCTRCTRPIFGPVRLGIFLSQIFWTLFVNPVHEHCSSRNFSKKKNIFKKYLKIK